MYHKVKAGMLPVVARQHRRLLTKVLLLCSLFLQMQWDEAWAQQPINGITEPAVGDTISGVVTVRGTAVHPDYLRYELAFWQEANPDAGWVVFAEGDQPVQDGVLALWDTAVGQTIGAPVFPDGRYQLRLRVVKQDYNYDEFYLTELTIQNEGPTPTPTPDETAVSATTTAASGTVDPSNNNSNNNSSFVERTPIPSLTPFPTPTPQATAVRPESARSETDDPNIGLLEQVNSVDGSRFRVAFGLGVQIVGGLFAALGIYLLIRTIVRWGWRRMWQQKRPEQ
ncbi:MAG: hypothetical protein GY943_05840 [Chloroflexi bacterium]|nr:hypothetical protein [Chloroflexota bacterium]